MPTGQITFAIRDKNSEFDCKYNFKDAEKRKIIRELTADDCIGIEPNDNPRYADAEVYKFLKEISVSFYGEDEVVKLYVKGYIMVTRSMEMVVVISFHEDGIYE